MTGMGDNAANSCRPDPNMDSIIPVILSGGSGSRLWPLSRSMRPKQFLGVTDESSLFQLTLNRIQAFGVAQMGSPLVVTNEDHRFLVGEQCRSMGVTPAGILLEPMARNTAPAIAVAAMAAMAQAQGNDPVLLVLPSDHLIADTAAFVQAVTVARQAAQDGQLVTFGIVPTHAETGYGYIQASSPLRPDAATPVTQFCEKPDLQTAQAFLKAGSYTWNSGMFVFKASVFLRELDAHQPELLKACRLAWEAARQDLEFIRLDAAGFAQCPSISIDHAVMEKTSHSSVVPLDAGWSDVGAWSAVWEVLPHDDNGNCSRGDVMFESCQNSYVHAQERLVALCGVEDLVVVETKDAVLVTHKNHAQDVKKIVDALKAQGRTEVDQHREVFRPWGSYDSVDQGERFQVKRIVVKPGARLSLQMHHHRSEHWIVVSGTARVTLGDQVRLVSENESVYIPIGETHMLENPGKLPLHLIEVQSGTYLGEDDIVRFEDVYGRV